MKIKKKCLLILVFFASFLLLLSTQNFAQSQNWKSLDYDVTVNEDGSMDVVETWNISISETNTIFKDFNIDRRKYSEIKNVKVSLIQNESEKFLEQINEEQYHVAPGCYYALPIKNNTQFEIAWNVGLDDSSDTRTYKVYYTITDVISKYNDCTELYWQFLGTDNAISGKNITGTIHLPKSVSDIEKLRVWAHGQLTGKIERISTDTVKFELPQLSQNTMLEIRVVTEEDIYDKCSKVSNENMLEKIISEEIDFADKANAERESARRSMMFFIAFIAILNIIILIFFIIKIKKYILMKKQIKEKSKYSNYDLEYFREIPDEQNATPSRALYLINYSNKKTESFGSCNIISATLLDLSLKGFIEFETINDKNIRIIFKDGIDTSNLTKDESIIYNMLLNIKDETNTTTTEKMQKYAKENYDSFLNIFSSIKNSVETYMLSSGKVNEENKRTLKKIQYSYASYFTFAILSIFVCALLPVAIVGNIICTILTSQLINLIEVLSEEAHREQIEWKGLKKYMEDYSLLKEKSVPDIVLWEKYLVYATVFGISKKVIKQLKTVHPEMFEQNNGYANYSYWNVVCMNSYGNNGLNILNDSVNKAYSGANSAYNIAHSTDSNGYGGGGGFSSGGGGRWWWRPVAEAVNTNYDFST